MAITYLRRSNMVLSPGAAGTDTDVESGSIGAGATVVLSWLTASDDPGVDGATGDHNPIEVRVKTGNTSIQVSVQQHRCNSAGTVQQSSSVSSEQQGTAGVKVFSFSNLNLGTWNSGDRLRTDVRLRGTQAHGNVSCVLGSETTDDEVVTPFGSSAPSASGGSTATVNVTSEGAGRKVGQGGATPTANVTSEGAGTKQSSGGATATVSVTAEGAGQKTARAGSTAGTTIGAEGAGAVQHIGGSGATVNVTSEGGGENPSGPPSASGGSDASVSLTSEGSGVRGARGGAASGIVISLEGQGVKLGIGSADAMLIVHVDAGGYKRTSGGATIDVLISAQGGGSPEGAPPLTHTRLRQYATRPVCGNERSGPAPHAAPRSGKVS